MQIRQTEKVWRIFFDLHAGTNVLVSFRFIINYEPAPVSLSGLYASIFVTSANLGFIQNTIPKLMIANMPTIPSTDNILIC